ncbi:hypothetical protein HA41_00690 [Pantoea conspicua]|uniref:Uncharacterized protein n=1 Tax=Pantoea conspicua TaxID=472705 RepID=A0A1X1C2U2_9GAMM|nr:hypothetical protein [Pantoea conspicua]ORM55981.1 hypothetical protein HA41_00690 [Pantoea conspicua]
MKILITMLAMLLPFSALAVTDDEIVTSVKKEAEAVWFPSEVTVESFENAKFFPSAEYSEYSRSGNVCGVITARSGGQKVSLNFISEAEEVNGGVRVGTPQLYDKSKEPAVARKALSQKCKNPL